jgi:hypothetical protein
MGRAHSMHGKDEKYIYKVLVTKPERDSGDLGIDMKTILRWILKEQAVRMWIGFL